MLKYIVVFAGASLLAISLPAKAQEQRDIVALSSEEIMTPSDTVPRKKTVIVDGWNLYAIDGSNVSTAFRSIPLRLR